VRIAQLTRGFRRKLRPPGSPVR